MTTCSKRFTDYPFAHRQPTHEGHCKLVHGHNWDFEVEFACETFDSNGFVIDFGGLGFIKKYFAEMFDHTLVLDANDPATPEFLNLEKANLCKLTILPAASAEGLAKFLFKELNAMVSAHTSSRVWVTSVTVFEDSKNKVTIREDK